MRHLFFACLFALSGPALAAETTVPVHRTDGPLRPASSIPVQKAAPETAPQKPVAPPPPEVAAPLPAPQVPFRADAGLTKAEAQIARGDYAQAVDTLAGVLARRPSDADALTYAGYAWLKLGDAKQAVGSIDTALRYDPRHLGANYYKARLFLEAGDKPRALEQMQALRMACGGADCPELSALQAELNKAPGE